MKIVSFAEIKNNVHFFGRIFADPELESHFFNWTCSGFEVDFFGSCLDAELVAFETNFGVTESKAETMWPWIAVFLGDEEEPVLRFEVNNEKGWYNLFKSDVPQKHRIKVLKLSENYMGKVGIANLKFVGEISKPMIDFKKYKLEFIGDSITCGFGNEVEDRDAPFVPKDENGWSTYGALTARKLNADYRIVAVSGISVSHGSFGENPYLLPSMDEIYEYTDGLYERRRGKTSDFQKWDFSNYVPDAIVINLGTNDVNAVKLAKDKKAEEQLFEENYIKFLGSVRRVNGPEPIICCTLGPLDYYLYDNILRAVARYQQQTNDNRIHCFKFGGVVQWEEGFGAVGHPSAKTHLRMSEELSDKLCELLNVKE